MFSVFNINSSVTVIPTTLSAVPTALTAGRHFFPVIARLSGPNFPFFACVLIFLSLVRPADGRITSHSEARLHGGFTSPRTGTSVHLRHLFS